MEQFLMDAKLFLAANAVELDKIWGLDGRFYERFARRHAMRFSYGQTRVVLIGDNFVIKVDRRNINDCWKQFGSCFTEYKMYRQAKEEGYDYLLAACFKVKGGSHYYYVMPKVELSSNWKNMEELDVFADEEIEWLNNNIFDLHNENYGIDDDGNYVAFDYAANCLVSPRWS